MDRCPASCTRLGPEDVRLHLGLTKRSLVEAGSGARVDRISIHPDWDKRDRLNDIFAGHDIAVLRLEREVSSYTSRVVPICLPRPARESYLLREDSVVDVTGFGVKITRKGTLVFPNTVQTARVTVMDTETCRSFWPLMTGNQICAIGAEVSQTVPGGGELVQDSCNGDSGGGLTATNFNGREVLLGIISFGEPDCGRRGGKPGVYTNVMDQLEWIQSEISSETTTSSEGTCRSDNGKACVFPFTFRNQKFRGCTQEFDDSNTAWCSTKTVNGEHIAGQGEWGYCLSGCPVDTPPVTESPWAACSATCGGGTQTRSDGSGTRRCNRGPCPPPASWSAWSACSSSCGGGSQSRSRGGVRDSRRCNTEACPAAGVEVASEYWLVGGTSAADHIERIKETGGGQVCSSSISRFPNSYSSQMGGFLSGRVVVCGGNSGTDSTTGKYRVHGDCYSASPTRPGDWASIASMKINTTNAAYTVHRDKLYVLGGYQKPACGYRPGVQVYSPSTNSWSVNTKRDPPRPLGAYSCAVTAGNKIFVIGGWYPFNHLPGADTCKEDLSASELTAVNNEYDYYQEYVQIYEPDTNTWTQGPSLIQRRRKHGCALVELNGRKVSLVVGPPVADCWLQGIMVAGGFNSRDGTLSTVEYLELGQDLNSLGSLRGARWNQLTSMRFPRRGKPLLLEGR